MCVLICAEMFSLRLVICFLLLSVASCCVYLILYVYAGDVGDNISSVDNTPTT
jgi:hypothetical protein